LSSCGVIKAIDSFKHFCNTWNNWFWIL
jgi:hypothetical protein